MNRMNWQMRPPVPATVAEALAASLGTDQPFPLPLAQILAQRGITHFDQAKAFFTPARGALHDPFLMQGMAEAVTRLLQARARQEPVLLYGDYDVDGTSAVALMMQAMRDLGFVVSYYIPDRYGEGYGISYQGIDYAQRAGVALIVSLDCGIKAGDKVQYAAMRGIEMIICDHHTPGASLPPALAVLDPKRSDCAYPYKELTGCGVGMKLLQGLAQRLPEAGFALPSPDYDPFAAYCDLLVLSIACDIVPITGENRVMAYHGLQKLRHDPLPGIRALMNQGGDNREWDISDLVFFLGPRINAAGRLGHARHAVEVLLGHDLDTGAEGLQQSNDARKDLDRTITEEALQLVAQDPAYPAQHSTVLYHPDWHKGVIGIVASRLIETHYRPTILLTRSEGKLVGSARSVAGFDLYQALEACDQHLLQWGGHKYAAGLSLKEEAYAPFKQQFEAVVAQTITPEQRVPLLYIDQPLHLAEIDARFIRLLNRMEPFGPQNRRPVFLSRGVRVIHHTVMKGEHLRLVLQQGDVMQEAVGFNLAQKFLDLQCEEVDVAFQPLFNTWNHKTRINLRLKDLRPAHEPE